jgi:hypothetical protein
MGHWLVRFQLSSLKNYNTITRMNSTIKEYKTTKSRPYPKLMQCIECKGLIVLMCSENKLNMQGQGVVVSSGSTKQWNIGDYSDSWDLKLWEDFEGVVELFND